jgi:hypothetical protein
MVRSHNPFSCIRSGVALARHFLSSLCRSGSLDPLFVPVRRPPPKPDSVLPSLLGNLPTFQPFNFQTIPRSIPFRIIFFAHPHHLTLTESYSYRKQGRGWGSQHLAPTQALRTCGARSNARNPNLFIHLLLDSLDTQGVGGCLFPLRGSAHSATLRYPLPRLASPPCLKLGALNEP